MVTKKRRKERKEKKGMDHDWQDWVLENNGKIYPLCGCRDHHLPVAKSQTSPIKRGNNGFKFMIIKLL